MPDPSRPDDLPANESEAIADILINDEETITRRPARVDGTDQPLVVDGDEAADGPA